MEVILPLTVFYRKSKTKQKSRVALKLTNIRLHCSDVALLLKYFFLHAN